MPARTTGEGTFHHRVVARSANTSRAMPAPNNCSRAQLLKQSPQRPKLENSVKVRYAYGSYGYPVTSVQTEKGAPAPVRVKLERAKCFPRARGKRRNVTVLPRMAGAPAQQEINEPTSK